MTQLSEETQRSIDTNPAVFETYILGAMIGSQSFYLQHGFKVCPVRPRIRKRRNDFSQNWMNIVYEGVCLYWGERTNNVIEDSVPRAYLDIYLNEAAEKGRILNKEIELIEAGLANIYTLIQENKEDTVNFVERGVLSRWLAVRVAQEWGKDAIADPSILTPEKISEWHEQLQNMPDDVDDETFVSVDQAIQGASNRGDLFELPEFPNLSTALGGGFAKGEHTLLAATTGGGKTVMAMQMASSWAIAGHNVIFVTTEQPPNQLMNRAYSNVCNIPHNFFTERDDICPNTHLPVRVTTDGNWLSAIQTFRETIRDRLVFFDWSGTRKTIVTDLAASITKLNRNPRYADWVPDILIFDWIGASLERGVNSDGIRHLYNNVASELKHIAVAQNLCVFSFAQLNKTMAKNKQRCDHTMLNECKSLPDQCANALYISSIQTSNEEGSPFTRGQFMNVAKSRFGAGDNIKILRDFEYQRFGRDH